MSLNDRLPLHLSGFRIEDALLLAGHVAQRLKRAGNLTAGRRDVRGAGAYRFVGITHTATGAISVRGRGYASHGDA